ncbi:MAG: carboxypeptidase regulatory-like domain-containing protein [Acidobacteria bacterium]|nr:carboxypeptidase regulatory-like domain-containing protein [Acidobacteriota bacterium]MBI3427782.1 carboxypeptidase regulatory-like domain-containing protein [Acidobacteriota bacterium]
MLCAAGWLLIATSIQAQTPNGTVNYGSLTGRVIGEDGPVPFATVTVLAVGGRGQGNGSRSVITDMEGNFKVDGLRAAALQIQVNAPGYVQESAAVSVAAAEPDAPAEVVTQTYYRLGDDVTLWLVKGGVITGRVLNPAGDPVIGVRVSAQPIGATLASTATAPPALANSDAQTDDRGIYRLFGLPAGTYVVVANANAVAGGGGGGGGGFGAAFGGGRPGQQRNPFANDGPIYHPSGGRAAAAEITVSSGAEISGIDIQYRSVHGVAISGTVAGAATERGPGAGFTLVTLTHKASGQVVNTAFLTPRGGPIRRGLASGPDTFSMLHVTDGEYELTAQRNSGEDVAAAAPVRVLVNGNDVTGVSLTLKPLAAVRAQVQLESISKCTAARAALLEEQIFTLRVEPAAANKALAPRPPAPLSVPNRAGEIAFRGLPAGRYRLGTQLLDERWFMRSIAAPVAAPASAPAKTTPAPAVKSAPAAPSRMSDASRNGLLLKAGERLTGVVVTVAEGAAALDGKAVKAGAAVPAGAWQIHLIPAERERAEDVLRYAETQTGNDGAFRFRNLAPGKYWVLAQPTPKEPSPPEAPVALDAAARLRLRRLAEAANQAIELQPCQRLSKYELQFK